eukprot:167454-Karenia_brevis.AAC.1
MGSKHDHRGSKYMKEDRFDTPKYPSMRDHLHGDGDGDVDDDEVRMITMMTKMMTMPMMMRMMRINMDPETVCIGMDLESAS